MYPFKYIFLEDLPGCYLASHDTTSPMHACMHACSVANSLQPNGPEPSSVHGILQAQKQYLKFFTSLDIYMFFQMVQRPSLWP